jgi:hypothetical protein
MALCVGSNRVAMISCVTSFRASLSAWTSSSTVFGSMIASQVSGGMIDIHTCRRYVVMVMVAAMPSVPLVEILRGIPKVSGTLAAFSDERWMHPAPG